jgi:hypothetical protein
VKIAQQSIAVSKLGHELNEITFINTARAETSCVLCVKIVFDNHYIFRFETLFTAEAWERSEAQSADRMLASRR